MFVTLRGQRVNRMLSVMSRTTVKTPKLFTGIAMEMSHSVLNLHRSLTCKLFNLSCQIRLLCTL